MQHVIAKKSNEALQAGYARALYSANVSGLQHARTGTDYTARCVTAGLELVAMYEAEINARIAANIAQNVAIELSAAKIEAEYWLEQNRIAEIEAAKIEALELQWDDMVASGLAEEFGYGWED